MKWKSARAHLKLDGDRILGISGGDHAGAPDEWEDFCWIYAQALPFKLAKRLKS
jgi:hypothetical protein